MLVCVECVCVDEQEARGCRAYREDLPGEDDPSVAIFCPACASREFEAEPSEQGSRCSGRCRRAVEGSREIAHALREVAHGVSYRRAAEDTRLVARRLRRANPRPAPGFHRPRQRQQRRSASLDGQLVANWMDVFAPVVLAGELPTFWPDRIAVDSVEFRISGGIKAGMSFNVFIAVGYEGRESQGRLWRMQAYLHRTAADGGSTSGS